MCNRRMFLKLESSKVQTPGVLQQEADPWYVDLSLGRVRGMAHVSDGMAWMVPGVTACALHLYGLSLVPHAC